MHYIKEKYSLDNKKYHNKEDHKNFVSKSFTNKNIKDMLFR